MTFSQLKIDAEKSVSVGSFPNPDAKFSIRNGGEVIGWYLYNNAFSTSPDTRVGFYNYMDHNTDKQQIGIKNELFVTSTSSAISYGMLNESWLDGSGNFSAGLYNRIWTSSSSANTKVGIYNNLKDNGGTGNRYALYSKGGDYAGFFNGSVLIQGTLVQSSDTRLKEDIKDAPALSDKLKQLKAKEYKLKKDKDKKKHYGFIAQDMETVFPEIVEEFVEPGEEIFEKQENQDGKLVEVAVGREPDQTYKSINYIELIPILVKVVQEQQVEIENLRAEVEQLKKK